MSGSFKGHLPWTMAVLFPQGDHEPTHAITISHNPPSGEIDSSKRDNGFNGTSSPEVRSRG
jgi:hypothetical protein